MTTEGYPDGQIGWLDVTTPDVAGAKAFYGALFGWDYEDLDDGEGNIIYHQSSIDGQRVAGMGGENPYAPQGLPAYWTPYVIHSDAVGVAAKAEANGGTILFPPMDVMGSGTMAIVQDPTGATIGVWQPATHTGAQVMGSPNSLAGNELYTANVGAAKDFYEAVFGWDGQATHVEDYITFENPGGGYAGARGLSGLTTSYWLTYFAVEDTDAAMAKALALGATVVEGSYDQNQWATRVTLVDPQGGVFGLQGPG